MNIQNRRYKQDKILFSWHDNKDIHSRINGLSRCKFDFVNLITIIIIILSGLIIYNGTK